MGMWSGDMGTQNGDMGWGHGLLGSLTRIVLLCKGHDVNPINVVLLGGKRGTVSHPGWGAPWDNGDSGDSPPQTHPCLIHTLRFELPQRCPGGWGEGSLRGAMRGPRAPQIPVGLGSFWGGRGIDPSALITPPPLPSCLPRPLSPHKLISPPGLTPPSPTVTRNPPSPGVPLPPITSPWQPSPVATIPPATTSPWQPHGNHLP